MILKIWEEEKMPDEGNEALIVPEHKTIKK